MKTILLPHIFRKIGWALLLLSLVAFVIVMASEYQTADNVFSYLTSPSARVVAKSILNNLLIIGWTLGALFVACGRLREEDEMTRAIRLRALLISLYIYVGILIISTLAIYGIFYFIVMEINLCLFPVVFLIVFELQIYSYRKLTDNEE